MSAASDEVPGLASGDSAESQPSLPGATRLADHWGLVLAYGLFCAAVGLVLVVWPSETLTVFAVLVAIQLLVSGALRLLMAIGARGVDGGVRLLLGLTGGLALVVGLLCLRDPVQTLLYLGILLGIWCMIAGIVDVLSAVVSPVHGRRAFDLITGLGSVLVGGFLLVNPELSLGLLVIVVALLMFLIGGVAVVTALRLRGQQHQESAAAHGRSALPAT